MEKETKKKTTKQTKVKEVKKEENEQIKKENTIIMVIKYVLPIVIALLIFVGFKISKSTYKMTEVNLTKYVELVSQDKQSMIFVTSSDCDLCDTTKALLVKMLQGSNIKTYEIKVDSLNEEELSKFMSVLDETKDGVTAPELLIVKSGKLVSGFDGPFDEDVIIEYLQNNGLVKKINTDSSEANE